jgi:hypothetical protein
MQTLWTAIEDLVARVVVSGDRESEGGQTLAEYSLILSFIGVGVILALGALGMVTQGMFWDPINSMFESVVNMIP